MNRIYTSIIAFLIVLTATPRHYDITAQHISTADGLPTNIVSRIWQSADGYMWFSTRSGLCRWDGYSLIVDSLGRSVEPEIARNPEFRLQSSVWQREGNGKMTRRDNDGTMNTWQLIPAEIVAYTHNEHFHVLDVNPQTEAISTYGAGLYLYDKPSGELTQLVKENTSGIIDDNYLTELFVDRTGCIWLVEDYLGVKCLRLNNLQYRTQRMPGTIQDANNIRCLTLMDDGKLLIGNQTGEIYTCESQTDQTKKLRTMKSRIYAALSDSKGSLWIGTRGEGLWHDYQHVEGLPSPHIFKIAEDPQGKLWVAMLEGGVVCLRSYGGMDTYLSGKNCHDIVLDRQNTWWVATEDALYRLSASGVTQIREGYFISLCLGRDGTVWAGSVGSGLTEFKDGRVVRQFTVKDGLGNDNIYSIIEDRQGNIWLGTEEGLSCLNPKNGNIHNYTFSASRLSNVFNERTAICLPDGRLVFGSHDGLIEIKPSQAAPADTPRTAITGMMVNGTMTDGKGRLSYNQNNLTFLFSNFQYAMLQSVVYQYRLDGIDTDWTTPTKEHSVTYRQLQPGDYVFRVRSSNGSGTFGEETRLAVTICQPWWNTRWAWCVYILTTVLALTTLLLIAWKIMRLHRQIDIERRVSAFKMDFYDRIQRELRNPVNVLQGAAENVQEYGTSKKTMQSLRRGSRRMLKLMDMIQQFHRLNDMQMQVKAEQDALNAEAEQRFAEIQHTIHAEDEDVREITPPPINKQSVLIIEEDEDNRLHLTDTLLPFFNVVSCQSFSESEEMVSIRQPSVVLLDVSADWNNGQELTRRLRARHPELPVVHLSAFDDDIHHLSSLRIGAADYVIKPFSNKVLVERMKRCLDSNPAPETTHSPIPHIVLTEKKDKQFLFQFQTILSQHIADENFSVEQFAELMHLGRTQFYKRVKSITGQSPTVHVHRARLDYAASLLLKTRKTIEEIMTLSGFHGATHFYNSFKAQFGMSPGDYRKTKAL